MDFRLKRSGKKKQVDRADVMGCKQKIQNTKSVGERERDDVIDCEQPWRKPKAEKQNKSAAAAAVRFQ